MNMPQPFWAVMLAILGTIIGIAVLYHPDPQTISLGVLALASNLISGSLGAFAGHATAVREKPPTSPEAPASTSVTPKE